MKKFIFILISLFVSISTYAWKIEYSDVDNTCKITGIGSTTINETVIIPSVLTVTKSTGKKQYKVTKLGKIFTDNTKIKNVTIPDAVEELTSAMFQNCTNLKSVTFTGNKINIIPVMCFDNCINLEEINLPNSIRNIEHAAFYNCYSLKKLVIPSSTCNIKYQAFDNANIENLIIEDNSDQLVCEYVKQKNPGGIFTNVGITNLYIGRQIIDSYNDCYNSYTAHPGWARNNQTLETLVIGDYVERVTKGSFENCPNLTTVTWNSTATTIPEKCFMNDTKLSTVNNTGYVTIIGDYAFYGCINLITIVLDNPTLGKESFNNSNINISTDIASISNINNNKKYSINGTPFSKGNIYIMNGRKYSY